MRGSPNMGYVQKEIYNLVYYIVQQNEGIHPIAHMLQIPLHSLIVSLRHTSLLQYYIATMQ